VTCVWGLHQSNAAAAAMCARVRMRASHKWMQRHASSAWLLGP